VSILVDSRSSFDANPDYLATIPTTASLHDVDSDYDLYTVRGLQPYVYTSCWAYLVHLDDTDASNRYVDFGPAKSYLKDLVSYEPMLHASNVTTFDNMVSLYGANNTCDSLTFCESVMWAKLPPQVTNHSIVMVTVKPWGNDEWQLFPCTIDAYWATVDTSWSTGVAFTSNIPANREEDPRKALDGLNDKRLVSVSPAWAQRACTVIMELCREAGHDDKGVLDLQGLHYANALSYTVSHQNVSLGHYLDSTNHPWSNGIGMNQQQYTTLMDYIDAESILRHFDFVELATNNTAWSNPGDLTKVEFRSFTRGYGYDLSETAVKLSLSVIVFYIAVVLGYLLYTIVTGIVASSWDSVAELVILAINSQRPAGLLKNTSVGVDTLNTYRQPVSIRINHHDSLELVLDSTGQAANYTEVLANEEY